VSGRDSQSTSVPTEDVPVRITLSEYELLKAAREFMAKEYGKSADMDFQHRAAWNERLGMLHLFVSHLMEEVW
jgi:hypothetical protein